VKKFDMFTVSTEHRRVTDRRTDRQTGGRTFCHSIVRAMHRRRAVKLVQKQSDCDTVIIKITMSRFYVYRGRLVPFRPIAQN